MNAMKIINNIEVQRVENIADETVKSLTEGYCNQIEEAFIKALEANNLPTSNDFITQHIKRVNIEGDNFEHYWYHYGEEDAKRILSIEKPTLLTGYNGDDFINNNYTMAIQSKYY
jgi:hypothetical protein